MGNFFKSNWKTMLATAIVIVVVTIAINYFTEEQVVDAEGNATSVKRKLKFNF